MPIPVSREAVNTPNLDRLARRGMRFERAYVRYPVCNPSRTSMLLGLRCEQTGIVGNQQFFRDSLPDAITFTQRLRQNGWTARSFGKILHAANTAIISGSAGGIKARCSTARAGLR